MRRERNIPQPDTVRLKQRDVTVGTANGLPAPNHVPKLWQSRQINNPPLDWLLQVAALQRRLLSVINDDGIRPRDSLHINLTAE